MSHVRTYKGENQDAGEWEVHMTQQEWDGGMPPGHAVNMTGEAVHMFTITACSARLGTLTWVNLTRVAADASMEVLSNFFSMYGLLLDALGKRALEKEEKPS